MSNSIIAQRSTRLLPREWGKKAAGGAAGDDYTAVLIGAEGAGILSGSPTNSQKTENLYLDVGDNVNANVQDCLALNFKQINVEEWLNNNCSNNQFFLPGQCENGHQYAKVSVCGKEWCPVCGLKGSVAHNRRFVRWLLKIQQFKRMRYMVFTIPEHLRPYFRTPARLTKIGRQTQELLKKQGFPRGLRRWHWFGDRSHKWHPHLNVLVEGGYMNGATLAAIKKGYAAILEAITGETVEKVSVRATYKPRPADMTGSLHYITRATFLDYEWDVEMACELHNFRNMVVWGKGLWKDHDGELAPEDAEWQLPAHELKDIAGEKLNIEAINHLVEHVCPVCGGNITWKTALPSRLLNCVDTLSFGAGYYQVLERKPPPLGQTVTIKCGFTAGQHGSDLGRWRYYVERVKGREDEIMEYQLDKELSRRSRSRYNKYLDDLAWLQVAADMSAAERKGNNAI